MCSSIRQVNENRKAQEHDKSILRELARQTAEIASLSAQRETIRLWKRLNGLKPERPMFMIDQMPWHELDVDGELRLLCEDGFCRALERSLRMQLYKWRHMRDDMVVEPYVAVPMAVTGLGFGIDPKEERLVSDEANDVVSHRYEDQLGTQADLEKIKMPAVVHDEGRTALRQAVAEDIFAGILPVRMTGVGPLFFTPWDLISQYRGVMNPLQDLMDRPEFIHKTVGRFSAAYFSLIDQLEEKGLLNPNNSLVHCTGAWTDELPKDGFDAKRPRACDVWTAGLAQMLSVVSPAMHDEFEIEYIKPWAERFGLVYYGCCDPLDRKVGIVRRIPHLRKLSMSPWADVNRGAEAIGGDFVFSRKPSPALLAVESFNPEAVEKDLRETLETCRRFGCPVEFILKDISTVRYDPPRLWKWAEIARKVVES